MERKEPARQLSLGIVEAQASQFHATAVEKPTLPARRSGSLIRQALYLDQEDAYAAGEVGFLARALVQATLPHSDPKTNEFVRRNGHFTLSILAPKDVGLSPRARAQLARRVGSSNRSTGLDDSAYFVSTVNFPIRPLKRDFASAPIASTTGVPRSMPTSAVSSAEKRPAWVCSTRPSATFSPFT